MKKKGGGREIIKQNDHPVNLCERSQCMKKRDREGKRKTKWFQNKWPSGRADQAFARLWYFFGEIYFYFEGSGHFFECFIILSGGLIFFLRFDFLFQRIIRLYFRGFIYLFFFEVSIFFFGDFFFVEFIPHPFMPIFFRKYNFRKTQILCYVINE